MESDGERPPPAQAAIPTLTDADGSTVRPRDWWLADSSGLFPLRQTTVFEKEPEPKQPVLYGPKGEPLTWKVDDKRLGFDPERAKR